MNYPTTSLSICDLCGLAGVAYVQMDAMDDELNAMDGQRDG
jgi:hypothetical protein